MHRFWNLAFVVTAVVFLPVLAGAQDKTLDENTDADESADDKEVSGSEESGDAADTEKEAQQGAEESSASDTAPQGATQTGTYTVRLRDLEDRINRLKEQIFRSKARLSLLAETVLDRKIAGSKAQIVFRNEMGGSFKLVKATFLLDGGPIFNKSDEGGSLADRDLINLFDGPVMPGDHTLSVVLHYKGHGYGIFSYLKGYSFKTRSSRTFTVNEGKALKLEIVGYEKGGVTTPLEERPDIRYIMNVVNYEGETKNTANSEEKE
jgi:hypothetical protein